MSSIKCAHCELSDSSTDEEIEEIFGVSCYSCKKVFCKSCACINLNEARAIASSQGVLLYFCPSCKFNLSDLKQKISDIKNESDEKDFYIVELEAQYQEKLEEVQRELNALISDNHEKQAHIARLKRGAQDFEESVYLAEQTYTEKLKEQQYNIDSLNKHTLLLMEKNEQLTIEVKYLQNDCEKLKLDNSQLLALKNDMLISIENLSTENKYYINDLREANYQILKEKNNRLSKEVKNLETHCVQHETYYNRLLSFKNDMIKRITSISIDNEVYSKMYVKGTEVDKIDENSTENILAEEDEVFVELRTKDRYVDFFRTS